MTVPATDQAVLEQLEQACRLGPYATSTELGQWLGLPTASAAAALSRLEDAGLAEIIAEGAFPRGGPVKRWRPTPRGVASA